MSEPLPVGWVTVPLGDVCVKKVTQGPPTDMPVPYIDISSIDRATKRIGHTAVVTANDAPTRARQWVRADDVLVSMTRPNLNAVAQVSPDLDGAVASTGFDILRSLSVAPQWIFYRVRTNDFIADVCEDLQGVVYPAIRPHDVRRHKLPLPPHGEQHRIVEALESYFTRLDDAVATLERVGRNLKRYRASVLKAAVEGRLVPTEAELARAEGRSYEPASVLLQRILVERRCRWEAAELAKIKSKGKAPKDGKWKENYLEPVAPDTSALPALPEGWCWASLDQLILQLDQGWSPRCERRPVLSKEEWGVIKTSAVQHMAYVEEGNKALPSRLKPRPRLEVVVGDILVTRAGPRVRVGVCCLVRSASRRLMLCDKVYRMRTNAHHVSPAYIELVLNSPRALYELERIKSGISDSGLNLTQSKFLAMAIPLPPRQEQARISASVELSCSIADVVSNDAGDTCLRAARLRQSFLKWAFEGKLVDQDPNDEPASRLLARLRTERESANDKPPRRPRGAKTRSPKS